MRRKNTQRQTGTGELNRDNSPSPVEERKQRFHCQCSKSPNDASDESRSMQAEPGECGRVIGWLPHRGHTTLPLGVFSSLSLTFFSYRSPVPVFLVPRSPFYPCIRRG